MTKTFDMMRPSGPRYPHLLAAAWMLLLCLCTACSDDTFGDAHSSETGPKTWATLRFSSTVRQEVKVTTRATLDIVPESRVANFFLFIFDTSGNRLYVHYFDADSRQDTEALMQTSLKDSWWVQNLDNNLITQTKGSARIFAPEVTNAKLYMIANIDADMVNISPESLNFIRTESDLQNLTAKLNQEITSRNGYFPMEGRLGVDISSSGAITATGGGDATVQLTRLDAKITVKVRVATDHELSSTDASSIKTTQTLKEFVPESWRVVNVPKGCYVVPQTDDYDAAGYFNTETLTFEGQSTETFTYDNKGTPTQVESAVNSFSFYMMENRESNAKKQSVSNDFHLRDRRIKSASTGAYDTSSGLWEYAPEEGTYLEIRGQVIMDVDVSDEAKTQQLCADVLYYIHLGDFASDKDDYDILRNHSYTYTITIKGLNNIEAEVTSSQMNDPTKVEEKNSGATGNVYIAKESIFTFDAHYGQRVFCFDAKYIKPETVTWYVKTPFGKEGVPEKVGDTEIPSGMDYKWVHFQVNEVDGTTGCYSQNNRSYPGDSYTYPTHEDGLMDVIQFTEFIKEETRKLNNGQPNRFIEEEDPALKAKFPDDPTKYKRHRIYCTVYIDEYYYEADPITGEKRPELWKEFVNQPNRMMHILCDSERSLDGESTATGSVITLRQRSIQTPYNINNPTLATAWGCEQVDETLDYHLFFHPGESFASGGDITPNATYANNRGNDDQYNGLYNTCCLLRLINGSSYDSSIAWDTYLDYARPNDYNDYDNNGIIFLRKDYLSMLYSVLMRNRDNNGNGKIDPEEMRWYIASTDQLVGLFMGDLGLAQDAQLYPTSVRDAEGTVDNSSDRFNGSHKWRSHVIASTQYYDARTGTYYPTRMWAEEGVSTGGYTASWGKQPILTMRCMRNLGMTDPTTTTILNKSNIPDELFKVSQEGSGSSAVYTFDLSNINEKSIRFYTSRELEPSDETNEMSRLYKKFVTGDVSTSSYTYENVKSMLDAGNSPVTQEGYRIPNVREAALMALYIKDSDWWTGDHQVLCCSYFSHSLTYGDGKANDDDTWNFKKEWVNIIGRTVEKKIRYVKDVK